MTQLIDVSHTVEDGLITYPGLPAPLVCDFLSREASKAHYDEGTTFQIARIEMVANTGTYVDSPFHRFADGADLAALELSCLADLDGMVIDATGRFAAKRFCSARVGTPIGQRPRTSRATHSSRDRSPNICATPGPSWSASIR